MKILSGAGPLRLVLLTGISPGCADDQIASTSGDTKSGTEMATTEIAGSGTGDATGTTGTGTTTGGDTLAPWYGMWYTLDPLFSINTPMSWGSGGDGLFVTLFDLRAGSATIRVESCLFGSQQYEYATTVDNDGVVVLEPVGGVHEFLPHGEIDRLFIQPGADCNSIVVKEVGTDGEEGDLFSSSGDPLARGELCLEKCAEAEGEQGLISDCGTPVPWACSD